MLCNKHNFLQDHWNSATYLLSPFTGLLSFLLYYKQLPPKDVFVVPGEKLRAWLKLLVMGHVQFLAVEAIIVLSVIKFIMNAAAHFKK